VLVDGFPVTNPASVVGPGSRITLRGPTSLRGEAKLRAALERFRVPIEGRIALDVGAAAGGFTKVLLEHGASRVYAVDAGHGQLLGSLRQDPRVVNLEATNLGELTRRLVPNAVEVITIDVSYLSLTAAVPQLERIAVAAEADLIALVKPMFELRLPEPPMDRERLEEALAVAIQSIEESSWRVVASMESPVRGGRGAIEFLIHARRV
jgi:23S rRNA (cytidine1920-2'-O)/16S rRNA (cytidine1409-2'-O)-methyltransferase